VSGAVYDPVSDGVAEGSAEAVPVIVRVTEGVPERIKLCVAVSRSTRVAVC
jgi:hypothetical protein